MRNTYFLVVNLWTGEIKVGKRKPQKGFGQFIYTLMIDIPERWLKALDAGTIHLQIPDAPEQGELEKMVQIREALGLDEEP